MINNHDIICFGFAEWDNPYKTNQHHLMSRFSTQNRVLFIESLGLRQPTIQKKDVLRIVKRLFKWFKGVRKESDNLYVFAPLVLPFYKYNTIRRFNEWFLGKQLDSVIRKLGFGSPIIWTYVPNAVEYFGRWKEKLSVYHCVDDISANPLVPKIAFQEMEKKLLDKVSLVFASSKALYDEKKKSNAGTYYMTNVADFNHFNKALAPETEIPKEMLIIPSPRIGFIGAVSAYKLDLSLISYIAHKHPEWSFVLIGAKGEGEKEVDLSTLQKENNIHIFGGRPYKDLPGFLKGFDVCLLPNNINDYTRNMFPMKFFEYLSSGKPVVSTALESIREFKDYFYLSENKEEFEKNIETALKENSVSIKVKRIELAKKYTWENRIKEMSEKITNSLRAK